MRLAVSEDLKNFSKTQILETPQNYEEGIALFKKKAKELTHGQKIEAIAGGIAGPFDEKKRALVASPQLKDWIGKPFKKSLEQEFSAQVYIENDAALAGLGEAIYGAGRGYPVVAYLTVSTGVGGARLVNGKIDEKTIGFEPGHQIIDADKTLCPECDGVHLGAMINGRSFEKRFGQRAENIDDPEVWSKTVKYLAYGLHNVTVFWSPEIIVLGGGVMRKIEIVKVEEELRKTLQIFPEIPVLKKAELGDLGGLWGAMVFLKGKMES